MSSYTELFTGSLVSLYFFPDFNANMQVLETFFCIVPSPVFRGIVYSLDLNLVWPAFAVASTRGTSPPDCPYRPKEISPRLPFEI